LPTRKRPAALLYPGMSQTDVLLRAATLEDAATLARFNAAMAWETEELRLDPDRLARGVRAVLDDPSRGFYLVALRGGQVVGQLMVTLEWSDWRNGHFWWIQSVYVEPGSRRAGVFRALYRETEARALRAPSCCGLRLYVERENVQAHATYESLGMSRTHYHLYEVDFSRRQGA